MSGLLEWIAETCCGRDKSNYQISEDSDGSKVASRTKLSGRRGRSRSASQTRSNNKHGGSRGGNSRTSSRASRSRRSSSQRRREKRSGQSTERRDDLNHRSHTERNRVDNFTVEAQYDDIGYGAHSHHHHNMLVGKSMPLQKMNVSSSPVSTLQNSFTHQQQWTYESLSSGKDAAVVMDQFVPNGATIKTRTLDIPFEIIIPVQGKMQNSSNGSYESQTSRISDDIYEEDVHQYHPSREKYNTNLIQSPIMGPAADDFDDSIIHKLRNPTSFKQEMPAISVVRKLSRLRFGRQAYNNSNSNNYEAYLQQQQPSNKMRMKRNNVKNTSYFKRNSRRSKKYPQVRVVNINRPHQHVAFRDDKNVSRKRSPGRYSSYEQRQRQEKSFNAPPPPPPPPLLSNNNLLQKTPRASHRSDQMSPLSNEEYSPHRAMLSEDKQVRFDQSYNVRRGLSFKLGNDVPRGRPY